MTRPRLKTLPLAALLAATATLPAHTAGQRSAPIHVPPVRALGLAETCRADGHVADPALDRISRILSTTRGSERVDPDLPPSEDVDAELRVLEADARRAIQNDPDDVVAAYRLAAVIGARTELAGGRDQVALADELHGQVRRVLELDPDHPGAHHILGRLNAGVMRLGGFRRFLAKHLVGGEMLNFASWDRARHHLEAAEAGDPCLPDHHYELALLYAETGESARAWEEAGHVLALTAHDRSRWAGIRKKAEALTDGN